MRDGPLVVVGDCLLDVDLDGTASHLAPDAPVPVVECARESHRAGGAGLAAILAAQQDRAEVVLITALGADRQAERLRQVLGRHVHVVSVPLRGGTPCKLRVRAAGQPMLRLDAGNGVAAPGPVGAGVGAVLAGAGAVLVSDYGRGMAAHPGIRALLARLRPNMPVVWDPHPSGPWPVRGVRLATPNAAEAAGFAAAAARLSGQRVAQSATRPPKTPVAAAAADAARLAAAWQTSISVTLGELGALLSAGDGAPFVAPASEPAVASGADPCGAGDCYAATAALVLRAGGVLTEAVVEAVGAATDFVRRGGARTAAPALTIPAADPAPAGAATAARSGWDVVARVRSRGGKVAATGGCFDLLHAGHVSLLREARRLGDCLVVCLNSDESVRGLKGPGRPLVSDTDRARVLLALESVDAVLMFSEPTPVSLLERLRPDFWVKGGDYAGTELAEADVVHRNGGQVVLLPYLDRVSTSRLVSAARQLQPRD